MFLNQILEQATRRLEQLPVLTRKLTSEEGVTFAPVSLGQGRIWMEIHQDRVKLTVEVGT